MTMQAVINAERNWHVERCDVLDGLRALPDGCINAVVTSPPYYALRSYLPADHPDKAKEHGSEPTPDAFVATMVAVFDEVRRVLRDDGVCWVNLGDSYCQDDKWGGSSSNKNEVQQGYPRPSGKRQSGLKPGDKLNMPHRVAAALQAAGWWWRDTVVWHKKSPMPESVSGWQWRRCVVKLFVGRDSNEGSKTQTNGRPHSARGDDGSSFDRNTTWAECPGCPKCSPRGGWVLRRGRWRHTQAHEYVFQFTKADRYFCDGEAAKVKANVEPHAPGNKRVDESRNDADEMDRVWGNGFANPRNVLSLPHEPTKEKHFAAYPTELVRRLLLPSLAHAYCAACGAPHAPMVERERKATRPAQNNKIWKHDDGDHVGQRSDDSPNLDPERHVLCTNVVGYMPTCDCNAGTKTGLVLDPYCGTGTTGEVALKLGARFIGLELNEDYKRMADRRVKAKLPLFA